MRGRALGLPVGGETGAADDLGKIAAAQASQTIAKNQDVVAAPAENTACGLDEPTDDELLTDWERDFLASIECQDFDLTAAQEAKRDEIYALIEERREAWHDQPSPQDHHAAWQPVGSVLDRMFQSFDFVPTADDDDPRWKRWHCRPGDLVEVRGAHEAMGRWFVTHASPLHFKIEDRRCFAQAGWPLVSGKASRIRARKVSE